MKRLLALILSMVMVLSLVLPVSAEGENTTSEDLVIENLNPTDAHHQLMNKVEQDQDIAIKELTDKDEIVKVIVIMESESIVEQDNDATPNDETAAMAAALEAEQMEVVAAIEDDVLDGDELAVKYHFTWLVNGFSAEVPYGSIETIKAMDGVKKVLLQPVYEVCKSDINTSSDGTMIGRESTWAAGYTGKGIKIAIIDTGLDYDHQNFQALPAVALTSDSATEESIGAVLDQLNASVRYPGLTASDVYYNTKVAFGFNYCDDNLNITHDYDEQGDHGTHVAGIAAANKIASSDVVGVAPDAQLYVMKVFGEGGGAYTADILAALEDALKLGADVVNMSLGTACGFTSDGDEIDAIYDSVAQTGTVLAVSAGNNYSAGLLNMFGQNLSLTSNIDNGVVGSPSTYVNTLSVASVENIKTVEVYIDADGYPIGYSAASNGLGGDITTLTGSYEFVAVPNGGDVSDYEGLDLTGKIALVQRGTISFGTKVDNAAAAGAVGCIVYNNTSGTINMDLTGSTAEIPAVSITMANGEYLISAQESNPSLKLSFPTEAGFIPNPKAYQISDFSSWGITADLKLKPEITAPGGNIYSTVNNGGYDVMSGTSMAAPNVAGMAAVVMQYVKETMGSETDCRQMVRRLLMSTSEPLYYDTDSYLEFSPRQQGSGLANAYNAVTSQSYLTVPGSDLPKAELGDDPERTGEYSFSYQVTNFSDRDAYYQTYTTTLTEGVSSDGTYLYMSGSPVALYAATSESATGMALTYDVDNSGAINTYDAYLIGQASKGTPVDANWTETEFRYDVNGDGNVTDADVQSCLNALVGLESDADLDQEVLRVAAGKTETVHVSVSLHSFDKQYIDAYFPNGSYVEGFSYLVALNKGGIDLSLPYLGFYGDWSDAPVLDDGFYWDELNRQDDDYTIYGSQTTNVLGTYMSTTLTYLGANTYVDEPFDKSHISVSPNEDGYADTVDEIYVSLLRNADQIMFRFIDMETGEVYFEDGYLNARKSVVSMAYLEILPFMYSDLSYVTDLYDFTDAEGQYLPNNTKVLLEVAVLGNGETEEETWSVPITVDTEAPQLLKATKTMDLDTGKKYLEMTFTDNVGTSVVAMASVDGAYIYAINGVEEPEFSEDGKRHYTVTYDITDMEGKVSVIFSDYAMNESYYGINLGGKGTPFGEFAAFQYNTNYGSMGWVSFDKDVNCDEVAILSADNQFVCAEYVAGYVFAQDDTGALYGFPYENLLDDTLELEKTYIATLDNVYNDLAYSYKEGKLYGLTSDVYGGYPTSYLYSINIGEPYYDANAWATVETYDETLVVTRGGVYGYTLAFDDEGTAYVAGTNYDWDSEEVTGNAHLWSSALEYNKWTGTTSLSYTMSDLGDLGAEMDYRQSMTWNHNDETLYWARFHVVGYRTVSELYTIDTDSLTIEKTGDLSGETYAMFAPLNQSAASRDEHQNLPEMDSTKLGAPSVRDKTASITIGGTYDVIYDVDPWYSENKEMVWSSSDESVATVDQNGVITGVAKGTAEITVANAKDETLFDTVTVEVTALSLKIEGLITGQAAGTGNTRGTSLYTFTMNSGISTMEYGATITAPDELNFGLSLAGSVAARDKIWVSEYGNTGMVYQVEPETGVVEDVLMPIDGDHTYGFTYSEKYDTFTAIMNMYMYVDLDMDHAMEDKMLESYDEEEYMFMYHRVDMLPYLIAAGNGFSTGENGNGASSEIVMCGITTMPASGEQQWLSTDFLGNYSGEIQYVADETLVVLDNVGRLWYIDAVKGLTKYTDDWQNTYYINDDLTNMIGAEFNGVIPVETDTEGVYNVLIIRCIDETPLTDMFRAGKMPRCTYHFSDLCYGGTTEDGAPIFGISLYDYWNNGTTSELYLYIAGVATGDYTYDSNWNMVPVKTEDHLFHLGNTGNHQINATIHSIEVLGGLETDNGSAAETNQIVPIYLAK